VHNQADRRGIAIESVVSDGCIISGEINRSLLFSSCRAHSHTRIDWSVLLPEVEVGRGARLSRCIIDYGVKIPPGFVIGEDPEADARRFRRTSNGITLVTQKMMDQVVS
jgi:glucose-1-phosphate adenylyltransferase